MKLATLMDGSRNGQLAVVSRDLTLAHFATGIATTMQQLLDDWNFVSPQLEDLSATLNGGKARHAFPFDPARCLAPLPRPVAWLRMAGGTLEAAAGGALAGARLTLVLEAADATRTLQPHTVQAQLAVITGDVPRGADADAALEAVRLLLLGAELPRASADPAAWRLHTHALSAFGPVASTPDELGDAWRRGRVDGLLRVQRAGRAAMHLDTARGFGPRLGVQPGAHLGDWLAAAAQQRPLAAGTLLALSPAPGAQDGAGDAETDPMDLSLAPGDRLTIALDTATADAPLGRLAISVDAPPEAAA